MATMQDAKKVFYIRDKNEVNEYLQKGYILIDVLRRRDADPDGIGFLESNIFLIGDPMNQ